MYSSFDMACHDYTNNDLEVNIKVNSENLLPVNHNGSLRIPKDPSWPKVPLRKTKDEPGNVIEYPCIVELIGSQNKSRTVLHPPQYRPVSSSRATSYSNSSLKSHIPLLSMKKPGETDPRFKKTQKMMPGRSSEKSGENRGMESIGIQTVTDNSTAIEPLDLSENFTFRDNRSGAVVNNDDYVHQNYSQNYTSMFPDSDKSVNASFEIEVKDLNPPSKTEKNAVDSEENQMGETENLQKKIVKCTDEKSSQVDSVIKSVDHEKVKKCHQRKDKLCDTEIGVSQQSRLPRPTRTHKYSLSKSRSDMSAESSEVVKYDETSCLGDFEGRQKSHKNSYKKASEGNKKVNCFNCKHYGESLDSLAVCDCHFKEIMHNLNSCLDTTDSAKVRRKLKSEHNLSTFGSQKICCRKSRFKTTKHKKLRIKQLSRSQNDILQSDLLVSKIPVLYSKLSCDNDSTDVFTSDFETRSMNEIPMKTQRLLNKSYLEYYNKVKAAKGQLEPIKMTKEQDADQKYLYHLAMGAPSNKKRRPNSFETKNTVPANTLQQCTVLSSMINQDLGKFPEVKLEDQKESAEIAKTEESNDIHLENVNKKSSSQKIKSTRKVFRTQFTRIKRIMMCLMIIYFTFVLVPIATDVLLLNVPDEYENIGYTEFVVQFIASSFQEAYGQYFQMVGRFVFYPVFSIFGFNTKEFTESSLI